MVQILFEIWVFAYEVDAIHVRDTYRKVYEFGDIYTLGALLVNTIHSLVAGLPLFDRRHEKIYEDLSEPSIV